MGWRDFQVKTQVEKKEKKEFNPYTDDFSSYFPFKPPKVEVKNDPINPTHDCFDPDSTIQAAIEEAKEDGWTDNRLIEYIDALREAGALKSPWGLKIKDSPLIGDYWILSDDKARELVPVKDTSFTVDELKPLIETSRVFKGSEVIEVINPN